MGGDIRSISDDSSSLDENSLHRLQTLGGNCKINDSLEKELPTYYRRPWPSRMCPKYMRAAFINSKYVAEDFVQGALAKQRQLGLHCPNKKGVLLKKLRDSTTFVERNFELSTDCNFIKYYVKVSDPIPKETINLDRLNITLLNDVDFEVPDNTALIQFVQNASTRHIFIRSEDPHDIINWYNAIRLGKFHRRCLNLNGMGVECSAADVAKSLTHDFDVVGWLSKTGPRKQDAWRKRWCMLIGRHMLYSENPLSAFAKGEIFIGSTDDGFSVSEGAPDGWRSHSGFAFTIESPERQYVFLADSPQDRELWTYQIKQLVLSQPTLDEAKHAASVNTKRGSFLDLLKW